MDAPAVAVTRDGKRIAVAWMDARDDKKDRNVYWTLSAGGPDASLADDTKDAQGHPSLGIDAAGVVHAAWEDARNGTKRIFHRSSDPKSKNTPLGEGSYPSVAAGKRTGVAWEKKDGAWFVEIGGGK